MIKFKKIMITPSLPKNCLAKIIIVGDKTTVKKIIKTSVRSKNFGKKDFPSLKKFDKDILEFLEKTETTPPIEKTLKRKEIIKKTEFGNFKKINVRISEGTNENKNKNLKISKYDEKNSFEVLSKIFP